MRKASTRLLVACTLLLLAAGVWGALLLGFASPERRHLEAGMEYAHRSQGQQAEGEWREAIRLNPNSLEAWNYLGEYYAATHNWPAAVEALQQVARLKPDIQGVHARLAECLLRSGDEQAAYRAADEALTQDPNDTAALALFCGLLERTGETTRRIDLLRRLSRLQPDNADAGMQLAEALVSRQLYTEALPGVEALLQRDPNNIEAFSLRGMIILNTDPSPPGLARAEADLLRALQEKRFAPFSHFQLGKISMLQGQAGKAVTHLQAAAQALPNRREVFFELADAYTRMGQAQEAAHARRRFETLRQEEALISTLEKRCAADPADFDAHLQLTRLLLQRSDYRSARIHLDKARALRPDDVDVATFQRQLSALSYRQ